jgi:DNA-binding LytR/AlgR family response regulator
VKINTLIIDDDANWRKIIGKFVGIVGTLNLVATCKSAIEAYPKLIDNDIDLIVCDIEMPEMSGLSFVKSLKNPPLVIFVTSHRDYALDCYEVSPVDFLLKPLDYERFLKAIEKVRQRLQNASETIGAEPYFFIRENQNYVQIAYKDVLYMKAQENFVQIVTTNETYMPTVSIVKMEEQLKSDTFLRVHRSYLVNRKYISTITKDEVVMNTGQSIPIGAQFRSQIDRKHIEGLLISRKS